MIFDFYDGDFMQIAADIKKQFGTPTYVYDEATLTKQATIALRFPNKYGLTVRYAMKACPNAEILKVYYLFITTVRLKHIVAFPLVGLTLRCV